MEKTKRVLLITDSHIADGVVDRMAALEEIFNVEIGDEEACTPKCTPGMDNEVHDGNFDLRYAKRENRHQHLHQTKLKQGFKPPRANNKFRIAPRRG